MNKRNTLFLIGGIVLLATIIGSYFFFSTKNEEKKTDAVLFKEEYESLNGQVSSSGKEYRIITIDENNPFLYQSAEEIVKKIEKKETFAVYFGFSSCPWCRSMLPSFIEVAKDLSLSKIYYVDISKIRDVKEIQDGKVHTVQEGTEGYLKLLEYFNDVLEEYTLKDENQKEIKVGEKRIYAPNVISVVEGKVDSMTTGISKKQVDAYMDLTEDMKTEMYHQLKCILECIKENEAVCTKPTAC